MYIGYFIPKKVHYERNLDRNLRARVPKIDPMKTPFDAFTGHPASVNETYLEHLGSAWSFSFRLIGAGIACFLHGLFPFLFGTTGSSTIRHLHERMVTSRARQKNEAPAAST